MTGPPALTDLERVEAVATYDELLAIADAIPVHDHRDGGRPRHHSVLTLLLVHVLAKSVYGGRVRRAIAELGSPVVWSLVSKWVREAYPDRPDVWLRAEPVARHHYIAFRDAYLQTEEGRKVLSVGLTESGLRLARELNLLTERVPISHPPLTSCIEADGKVVKSITRVRRSNREVDPVTGELRVRRHDPDVRRYKEGDSDALTWGHRFVPLSTRGAGWMQRVILGVASAPTGSEIDVLMPMIEAVHDRLQIAALLYDGALHGVHINQILRRFGIVCVAPVSAKRSGQGAETRIEREVRLPDTKGVRPNGSRVSLELWSSAGAPCLARYNEAGHRVLMPLVPKQLRRSGRPGTYRLYGEYVTEDGTAVRLPLYQLSEDETRRFNRCEHLRPFPPGSEEYLRLYPRRSDTESLHRQLEDACWQKRANCYGRARVHVDVLGFALAQNAIARYVHRRNAQSPPAAAAA